MTNYIPHHRKKKNILEKREKQLIKLIKDSSCNEKIIKAAENVREAQIRVINSNKAQLRPVEGEGEAQIKKAKIDTDAWLNKPIEKIIEDYRNKYL